MASVVAYSEVNYFGFYSFGPVALVVFFMVHFDGTIGMSLSHEVGDFILHKYEIYVNGFLSTDAWMYTVIQI